MLKKVSTRYEWADTEEKCFESAINKNPEKYWTKERLDKVEEYVQKNFLYIGSESTDDIATEEEG